LTLFGEHMKTREKKVLTFKEFLALIRENPDNAFSNHFQFFHKVITGNLKPLLDKKTSGDPENIGFVKYDSSQLFEENVDRPFFSDTLLNNKLMQVAGTFVHGSLQNKIYVFRGPPGCGKSTGINNMLKRCEEIANDKEGRRYEIFWKIKKEEIRKILGTTHCVLNMKRSKQNECGENTKVDKKQVCPDSPIIEVPCPSHDPPILILPKDKRMEYLEKLFADKKEFFKQLTTQKKYEWVFKDTCCTICESLFWQLFDVLTSVDKVLQMMYVRPYEFNRRLGEGISVFNPDDKEERNCIISDEFIQNELDMLFGGNKIKYVYSKYARTNYGFYVLMDVKKHNAVRLEELHNIISEGCHKVGHIEEGVNSIFLAIMNPDDIPEEDNKKEGSGPKSILSDKSFKDRQDVVNVSYMVDPEREIDVYRQTYSEIDKSFLPRVLLNFAKAIISTRMKEPLDSVKEWIKYPSKYAKYCDSDLILLRMELYNNANLPKWISDEDKKSLKAPLRRKIIAEAMKKEGIEGCSGRDSINLFYKFFAPYVEAKKLINMKMLMEFFKNDHEGFEKSSIPSGFLKSLLDMYDYSVVQEVKESLFYYNEDQIVKDLLHYLFAIFQDIDDTKVCPYTKKEVKVTEDFLEEVEYRIIGNTLSESEKKTHREEFQESFSQTISQELAGKANMRLGEAVKGTEIYKSLYEKCTYNLKQNVLNPFINNENFRRAIKDDYGTSNFASHDKRIKKDVERLIKNLQEKFGYTEKGAQEVCVYVIDEDLAKRNY